MAENSFLKRQGANFLDIINNLKRNRQVAAEELGIELSELEKIISGKKELPHELIKKAAAVWPVSERDFMLINDDAPDGVLIMRADASAASARILNRGGRPYYEYRDTAMSRVAPFRPEWILELCEVNDNDPENSRIQWNKGHFMHQFTMFVGPVNFYYQENGKKKVLVANTGDSMYITPFVRHTFATRIKDSREQYDGQKGLILALTYGNKLMGDVQHELGALGGDIPEKYLLNTKNREKYFASLLLEQMVASSMNEHSLAEVSGINQDVIQEFISGKRLPNNVEYQQLAQTFNINVRDLMPPDVFDAKVITKQVHNSVKRNFANYTLTELAGARYLPFSKAFIVDVDKQAESFDLNFPLHEYGYNFGDKSTKLGWKINNMTKEDTVHPGDSFYVKPSIPHCFSAAQGSGARLLSLRIGGKVAGEAARELSHICTKENLRRVYEEHMLWYDEERQMH